jgi:hypothetical protein
MNFGLALASNRVQGTRVNLSTITGDVNRGAFNKTQIMDETLKVILGGDVSPATRDALLKQLDQDMVVSLPGSRAQMDQPRDRAPQVRTQMDSPTLGPPPGGFQGGPQQQQRPRVEASINDPVTKVVGLILGTPEFQRQ